MRATSLPPQRFCPAAHHPLRKLHGAAYMLLGTNCTCNRGAGRYVAKCIDIFIFKNLFEGISPLIILQKMQSSIIPPFCLYVFDFIFLIFILHRRTAEAHIFPGFLPSAVLSCRYYTRFAHACHLFAPAKALFRIFIAGHAFAAGHPESASEQPLRTVYHGCIPSGQRSLCRLGAKPSIIPPPHFAAVACRGGHTSLFPMYRARKSTTVLRFPPRISYCALCLKPG